MTAALAADVAVSNAALRRYLHGLPGVDQVGAEGRAAMLSTRSIKAASKERAIDLAISMVDLTTLEGMDTPGKVRALCAKALRPDPTDPTTPHVAAVCVYGDMAAIARDAVGDALHVAAVATAFPSGRASLAVKLLELLAAGNWGGCCPSPRRVLAFGRISMNPAPTRLRAMSLTGSRLPPMMT